MYTQGKTLDEIYDLFAVRIIVDTVTECYSALGIVHELYKPIPGRFKDYIAMPKPNMYQSLHTTLIDPKGKPFEVQIRTWEMHRVAEQGVAAHWKYKEGITGQDSQQDEKLAWIRQMLEVQSDASDSEDFLKSLKIDLFADEVFVFTPRGDVVSLPQGATPIDFAFSIHTAVGCRMMGAKANSRIVPLDYVLQNGDIVEIITSSNVKGPSRDWLNIVKTGQARSKINAWFKKENREVNIEKGKEAVDREIKKLALDSHELFKNEYIEQMLKRYGFKTLDDAYSAVGYGGITAAKIVIRLREFASADKAVPDVLPQAEVKRNSRPSNGIEVEGVDNCLVHLSKCCNPVPGDEIIGFITRGRGVSVHRANCVNVKEENLSPDAKARMIRCSWADGGNRKYTGELYIECADRKGVLADIASAVSESQINIISSSSRASRAKMAIVTLEVEVTSRAQIDKLTKKLYGVPGIFDIRS
jgi:GTP pyrophosphokinase